MTVLRVGNASGFYGDRFAAWEEMLTGGPVDVLTGDYLAELTMLILGRDRLKDPSLGYARTFLKQLETTRVVSCTEAAFRFLGLSMAGWNALVSLGVAAFAALAALRPQARHGRA